jgi:hypothetical protein
LYGRGGERRGVGRQSFGTAASNESIVPTHDDRLIQTIIEMVTGKTKSKWPEKNLRQYHNIEANYRGIASGRGEKQRTNICCCINFSKY